MGRPPCCDKEGVKKGPWTPEEDLVLVSYIQEHGPRKWSAVATRTGLMRCCKSCRLRWTHYLRPGIKRGNFTDQEEKLIVHLQELLGNSWAAIASYLPGRTGHDIKNYWYTHLQPLAKRPASSSKGQWGRRLQTDFNMARNALRQALASVDDIKAPPQQPKDAGDSVPVLATGADSDMPPVSSNLGEPPSQCSPTAAGPYVMTIANISRMLDGWTRKGGLASGTADSPSGSSGTDVSYGGATAVTALGSAFEYERNPAVLELSAIETWLFADDSSSGYDVLGVPCKD